MAGGKCSLCGQAIVPGTEKILDGKKYCATCYLKALEAKERSIALKTDLVNYIIDLFRVGECPPYVSRVIDKAVANGKKIPGIKATIHYYYEVLNNPATPDTLGLISTVIDDWYERTKIYVNEQKEIYEKNLQINLNLPPQKVIINKTKLEKKEKQRLPKYQMEDL